MGNYLATDYQKKVFKKRYAQENETSAEEMFERVARKAAEGQGAKLGITEQELEALYYAIMVDRYFIPGGRILANVGGTGTNMAGNCFVIPISDSRQGIMKCQADTFETNALGGGTGTNYSPLRPKGAEVKGVRGESSGPCSFIEGFDGYAQTIKQGGSRRAARMTMLNVDHPDIYEFIHAKQDLSKWQTTNISVGISDEFMEAVEAGRNWVLEFDGKIYETVKARDLWNEICQCAWNTGEPGVMFLDTLNRKYPLKYCRTIDCVNVCGEVPLPAYGMCILGSMVMPTFVKTVDGKPMFDFEKFADSIKFAVAFLDSMVDISTFPIPEIEETVRRTRSIGLGVTGLADALFLLGIPYGDNPECLSFCDKLGDILYNTARSTSEKLGQELGPFPDYDVDLVDFDLRRNSTLLAFAPTGSVSGVVGCGSYGIEPHYAPSVIRNEELGTDVVSASIFEEWGDGGKYPEWARFVDGVEGKYKVDLQDHLAVLSTLAPHVDSAISKTINLPEDATVEQIKEVYTYLWKHGVKGGTVFRNGCRENQPVSVNDGKTEEFENEAEDYDLEIIDLVAEPREVPVEAEACRYKLKYSPNKSSLYITLTDDGDGPLEVFFSTLDAQTQESLDGMALALTTLFRRGIDCQHLVDKFLRYESPTGGGWYDGKYVPSMLAGIGAVIRRHFEKMGYITRKEYLEKLEVDNTADNGKIQGERCPECGMYTLVPMEGCAMCTSCGFSQCG